MIYLLLAVVSSSCVAIFMRLSEKYICSEMAMFMANYGICATLAIGLMTEPITQVMGKGTDTIIGLGCITGVLYLAGFVLQKYNMTHNGMVLTSTFAKLGVLIPTLMAVLIFGETPELKQILGIVLAIVSIILIQFEKEAIKDGRKKLWLLAVLLGCGLADSMSNIYEQIGSPSGKDGFLLMTFTTALILAAILAFHHHRSGKAQITKADLIFGFFIGIPNYFSARFLLLSLGSMDAVIVYPVFSVATLITITIVGLLCFHENLSKKKVIALILIAGALILMN